MTLLPTLVVAAGLFPASPAITQYPSEQKIILAAADDKLGVAMMSAVVTTAGGLNRGSGATAATKTAGGTYTVTFSRDVTDCTYVTVLGDVGTALPPTGAAIVSRSSSNSSTVFVETMNQAGSLADASFHLIVFCAQ